MNDQLEDGSLTALRALEEETLLRNNQFTIDWNNYQYMNNDEYYVGIYLGLINDNNIEIKRHSDKGRIKNISWFSYQEVLNKCPDEQQLIKSFHSIITNEEEKANDNKEKSCVLVIAIGFVKQINILMNNIKNYNIKYTMNDCKV